MAGRVKWTETALDDLDNIAAYIARDSQFYASVIVREVRDAARSISFMPLRGRIVPELDDETDSQNRTISVNSIGIPAPQTFSANSSSLRETSRFSFFAPSIRSLHHSP